MHLSALEQGRDIVFLHQIQPGPAGKSYGIAVAKLAGLPVRALKAAQKHLNGLENQAAANRPQLDISVPCRLKKEMNRMWTALWIKQRKNILKVYWQQPWKPRSRQPDPARSIVRTVPSERFVQIRILISVGGAASNHMENLWINFIAD
ncbi:DNA mismatch repair protein MutS [Neisseria gonorrhoeae]|uniref:DNA mismatch repair protein MutS n=1 Tax=Neisseria gonorrhoeae TaxID=485 RepID=A0A378W211_NEIGO|nr:DNA mismatch repair protein MutS [Neisseria gonorrhoeae]